MSRSRKTTLSHRLEYLVFRTMESSLCLLSLETTYELGAFVGRLAYRFARGPRRRVIRNLRFAFGGEKSLEEIEDLAARVFERTGSNLFCSLRVPFLTEEQIMNHLEVEGLDEILNKSGETGIVAVSPHMGNWEMLAQATQLAQGAFEAGTHYRPLNNRLVNNLIERRRKQRGLKLFAKRSSGHSMAAFVRSGGLLGILADQRVGSRGFPGVFFGRPTTCSSLPSLMAKRGEGKLYLLVCRTIGHARWKISFKAIEGDSAQDCATELEEAWRSCPEDVFWFEERWRLNRQNKLSFLEKYPEDHTVTRPLRTVNLAPDEISLPTYHEGLMSEEPHPIPMDQPKEMIREVLAKINAATTSPVDVFFAPEAFCKKLSRFSGKILVLPGIPR